jgi:hypothetical protein
MSREVSRDQDRSAPGLRGNSASRRRSLSPVGDAIDSDCFDDVPVAALPA